MRFLLAICLLLVIMGRASSRASTKLSLLHVVALSLRSRRAEGRGGGILSSPGGFFFAASPASPASPAKRCCVLSVAGDARHATPLVHHTVIRASRINLTSCYEWLFVQ
jgi:hypothetical protein